MRPPAFPAPQLTAQRPGCTPGEAVQVLTPTTCACRCPRRSPPTSARREHGVGRNSTCPDAGLIRRHRRCQSLVACHFTSRAQRRAHRRLRARPLLREAALCRGSHPHWNQSVLHARCRRRLAWLVARTTSLISLLRLHGCGGVLEWGFAPSYRVPLRADMPPRARSFRRCGRNAFWRRCSKVSSIASSLLRAAPDRPAAARPPL